jgi:hypothetical protein
MHSFDINLIFLIFLYDFFNYVKPVTERQAGDSRLTGRGVVAAQSRRVSSVDTGMVSLQLTGPAIPAI